MTATSSTPIWSRLDSALGRFTMYRLVLWVLAVLAGYSLLLDALGWLRFGLPEMIAHLVLCLGLSYASNRGLAAVFHVRPHSESALITGLLLYFLFWPSQFSAGLQYLDLAGVALACVLASVSKFALAWRGRHIFNAAAAGAFITGLTGLNIATWWAATPAMLWLVLPGALLVLYRVRKLLMAAIFTLVVVSISAAELLRTGMGPDEALWQTLAQRPVVFFVGFMLTEPLTLPPRRWQQLTLAAVVGLLFAVPFNLGVVANSPELALLAGNALAFLAGQRGRVLLRFRGSRPLTPTTTEFSFQPERPLRFAPGQYIELNLPHSKADRRGRRRVFSLTSPPDSTELTIGVGTGGPLSTAKQSLLALAPGEELTATSVGGDFVLPRATEAPVLLIAAGIGITPYLSQLSGGSAGERNIVLLYLAVSAAELAYADELERTGVRVIARLGDGSAPPAFMQDAGAVRIDGASLKELVPDVADRDVYVSGSPASVRSLSTAARRSGAQRIHTDSFPGY